MTQKPGEILKKLKLKRSSTCCRIFLKNLPILPTKIQEETCKY